MFQTTNQYIHDWAIFVPANLGKSSSTMHRIHRLHPVVHPGRGSLGQEPQDGTLAPTRRNA